MILADKIISLRKKSGWSQEELAEKLNVSRQSVSKWEGAQSVPDLQRILQMSRLFGVSTDYLLKDELEAEEPAVQDMEDAPLRRVSMEEASAFLAAREAAAKPVAFATLLCILSPLCLILLSAYSGSPHAPVSQNAAVGIGLIVLILMVAAAVAVFILTGMRSKPFEWLETEPFETEYGVDGMVRERQRSFQNAYVRLNVLGACLCILSVIPLFAAIAVTETALPIVACVAALMVIAGAGVVCFILAGIPQESFKKLLQQGEYSRSRKAAGSRRSAFSTAYWLVATAVFLGYSFITDDWGRSWIVWPIAGVLYGAALAVLDAVEKR